MVAEYQRAVASLGRLDAVIKLAPEDRTSRDGRELHGQELRGEIEFREVSVEYDGSPALDRVSFRVPAGGTLAIVGRVGSGKSTLARLIPRLIDADAGQVLIDGIDVRDQALSTLRDAIGYVPQDAFLFSATLRDNIALGMGGERSETTPAPTTDPVDWAAEVSQLSADLDDLPAGLESVVGERGITLSGGQRQRTALARAVIRNPHILILDDALASVDTHTEEEILGHLRGIAATRTTILIAHRLSTVREADQILVLDDGRIVEQGSHDQLVAANGLYADIHRRQNLASELTSL
jgi:ATP-binding cassette subfamily B multidrug efflux pump